MKKRQLFNQGRGLLEPEMLPFYEVAELNNGDTMMFQGELTTDFFIIKSGKLEVIEGSGSKAVCLDTLEANDVFGEIAFFDEGERSATVRSLGKSVLYRMTREHFADMATTKPQLALEYLVILGQLVSGKLRRIDKMIAGVTGDQKIKRDPDLKKLVNDIKRAMKSKRNLF
ncbi:MAG: cyclic nucleotide-binding domain-containing protein [Candidatus Aegiribacteria sp.]|nr:cyclic nucleotide-binding domain-containing protein [Candidatus Aegiribacteria sp.]